MEVQLLSKESKDTYLLREKVFDANRMMGDQGFVRQLHPPAGHGRASALGPPEMRDTSAAYFSCPSG